MYLKRNYPHSVVLGDIAVWYEYYLPGVALILLVQQYNSIVGLLLYNGHRHHEEGAAVHVYREGPPGICCVLCVYAVRISEYAFRRLCQCFWDVVLHCFAPKPQKTGNAVYHDFAMPLRWRAISVLYLFLVRASSRVLICFIARYGLAAQLHSAAALQCWRGLPRVRWALRILPALHFWFYWWSYSSQQQTVRCRDQLGRRSAPRQEGQW